MLLRKRYRQRAASLLHLAQGNLLGVDQYVPAGRM